MSRKTAAALFITRSGPYGPEVFLAERAPELRFFGGYHALPGGTLSPSDAAGGADAETALERCALRELFEETGLLLHELVPANAAADQLSDVRRLLVAQDETSAAAAPAALADLLAGSRAPARLHAVCRIETPPFAPVRYDTVFYHVPMAAVCHGTQGHEPDVWQGELVGGRFWHPGAALDAWRRGDLLLVPPVVILLELLAAHGSLEAFLAAAAGLAEGYHRGKLHQVRFVPGVVLAPLKTPTLPPATTTNCYIIGHDELWVVDPGSPDPAEQQRLLVLLDELCARGARLGGILSTHHHPDHIGGVNALSVARNLPVRGHAITMARLPAGHHVGAPIADGEVIALGSSPDGKPGWHLRAIHTPGHDRGHLCFHESRYGTLVAGDMLSTISTIIVDPPEGHLATYLASLERLLQEPIQALFPAHGPPQRDGQKLVRQYLRHRRQREASLVEALKSGPATAEQLLPRVYWDADPSLHRFAIRSLLAGLEKLVEEGRAMAADGTWRLVAE